MPHTPSFSRKIFSRAFPPSSASWTYRSSGSQAGLKAKIGGGAPSCPSHSLHLPFSLSPQAVWVFSEHLGFNEPWAAPEGQRRHNGAAFIIYQWCSPHNPGLCRGSDSTSQPLLPQCPDFSLDFCLCSVVFALFFSAVLPWSLAGVQSRGLNIWSLTSDCLCSSVFVHSSKNVCVCSAWRLSQYLHLLPRYSAFFCRLHRHSPQLPQPSFLDLIPKMLLKAPLTHFPTSSILGFRGSRYQLESPGLPLPSQRCPSPPPRALGGPGCSEKGG